MDLSQKSEPVIHAAARWFWWIAGLSLINTVLYYSGSTASFVFGLAMTSLVGEIFSYQPVIGGAITLLVIGFYVAIGKLAHAGKAWAFYLGLAVYVIDALLYAGEGIWLAVAVHVYAAFFIGRGILRLREVLAAPSAAPEPAAPEASQ
ncbi:MAG: hypothetical protein V4582_03615 [Pseudomonadota bacterium]